ncbi:MAG: hypothetical protein HQM11_02590 [SAR324 cluster bacterium]|nr:hypothetical protein [SAR324 cluster bacterium]
MASLKHFRICLTLFLFLIIPGGCADIVQPSNASVCEDAFNARDYDTAIEKCTDRKSLAGAYLGKAGFDIVSLLKSSESPVETLEDPTSGAQLGSDVSAGASVMNILQIGTSQISSETDRLTAMETARTYLAKVSELLKDETASTLSGDEIFLEIFATLFDTILVYVETLDKGTTDDDGVPEPILTDTNGKQYLTDESGVPSPYLGDADGKAYKVNDGSTTPAPYFSDATGKAYKTNADGSVAQTVTVNGVVLTYTDNTTVTFTSQESVLSAVKVSLEYTDGTAATFDSATEAADSVKVALAYTDGSAAVFTDLNPNQEILPQLMEEVELDVQCVTISDADSALIKADGHIWDAEQYGAFCSIFREKIIETGTLDQIKEDMKAGNGIIFDITEVQAEVCAELVPMIESFSQFSTALNKLIEKAGSNTASDNDTISGSSAAIDELLAELGCSR